MLDPVDPGTKDLYRLGGVSAIVLSASYVVITVLYVVGGAVPDGAQESLTYLSGHAAAWWAILGLSVLTDFLFVPLTLALYVALKDVHKNAMLTGAALVGLFVVLDLAITWPNYSALITLGGRYTAATSDADRAAFLAAAHYASAVLKPTLFAVYAILVPSLGILLISLVMLRSAFGAPTAYVGIASGVLGTVSVVGPILISALGTAVIAASILTTVWVFLAGYRLYRSGQAVGP